MPDTRTMPAIEDLDAPHSARWRIGSGWVVGAVLAVAGVILAALFLRSSGNQPDGNQQVAGDPPTTAAAPEVTTAAEHQTANRPVDRILAIRQAVSDQAAAGRIDEKAAEEIDKKPDELQEALAEGRDDKVADKARDVTQKLSELHREGKITSVGWAALQPTLNRLTADLPAGDGDDD